jgi:glutamyl-tRNA synthetase
VFSFLLTWLLARKYGGTIALRIDDIDASRCRPEYIEDIFFTLDWLGLSYEEGPKSVADFYKFHSQQLKLAHYDAFLADLAQEWLFPCACSRKEIAINYGGLYQGNCLALSPDSVPDSIYSDKKESKLENKKNKQISDKKWAWRLQTQKLTGQDFAYQEYDWRQEKTNKVSFTQNLLQAKMPYFILRTKENRAAYQLVSLVEDVENHINFIVRGKDLVPSTQAQIVLATLLPSFFSFQNTFFLHHDLQVDDTGQKLSKSAGATAIYQQRKRGEVGKSFVFESFSKFLGLKEKLYSLNEFECFFKNYP